MRKTRNLGKHGDRHISEDSCRIHGIGIGECRRCRELDRIGVPQGKAKHRAVGDLGDYVSEGLPRMFSL